MATLGIFPKKIPLEISAPFFICRQVGKFSHPKKTLDCMVNHVVLLYMMTLMHIECYLYQNKILHIVRNNKN